MGRGIVGDQLPHFIYAGEFDTSTAQNGFKPAAIPKGIDQPIIAGQVLGRTGKDKGIRVRLVGWPASVTASGQEEESRRGRGGTGAMIFQGERLHTVRFM